MAATPASADALLADAISKMDAMSKRMDALEAGEGSKNPITKGDDNDSKKRDSKRRDDEEEKSKEKCDDDDDKKDDGIAAVKTKILADAKGASKSDAGEPEAKMKDDDGELEIKHDPEKKGDKRKDSVKKADAKKDDKKSDAEEEEKDDDAEEEEKKKEDSAKKADSLGALKRQLADQAAVIARLESLVKPKSDDEHAAFADAQARADAVFVNFGSRAPRPMEGETLFDYRKRLATKLKSHSSRWKDVKFSRLDDETFTPIESQVYDDAIAAAANPVDLQAGELREVTKINPQTGVRTIEFYGKESFVKQMGRPGRRVAAFRTMASQ
jgi:hypothetical protein